MNIINTTPPSGDASVTIDNRHLAVHCAGSGGPPVIFETGIGAESGDWQPVQAEIALRTLTWRYDRAGRGASDPASSPRKAMDMISDLHAALEAMHVSPPYLLVGQSLGGLLMRVFAHRYRAEVAGLVLVDSTHPDQFETFAPTFPPPRILEPAELKKTREFWQVGWRHPESTVEHIDFPDCFEHDRQVTSLGNLPIHVMIAGTFLQQRMVPLERRRMLQANWDRLQREFLTLSSNATASVHEKSGHFIQRDDPGAVISAIHEVLDRIEA